MFIAHIIHNLRCGGVWATQQEDDSTEATTAVILYNEREIKEDSKKWSSSDLSDYVKKEGYNLWIDVTTAASTPSRSELERLQQSFCLDEEAIKAVENGSKKPQARMLKEHIFTIFLNLGYRNIRDLDLTQFTFSLAGAG